MVEHVRVKDDGVNSFLAGFATSVVLGANGIIDIISDSNEEEIIVMVRYWWWVYDVWFL